MVVGVVGVGGQGGGVSLSLLGVGGNKGIASCRRVRVSGVDEG